ELMPEADWRALVRQELDRVLQPRSCHHPEPDASPLQELVRAQLAGRFKAALREELNRPEYTPLWDGSRQAPGAAVRQIIADVAPQLTQAMWADVVGRAVQQLRTGSW